MLIKKNKAFILVSWLWLIFCIFILTLGINSFIKDIQSLSEKVIFSLCILPICCIILIVSLYYSFFRLEIQDDIVRRRYWYGKTIDYDKCHISYKEIFPYKKFKNYNSYFKIYYNKKKIAIVTIYDSNYKEVMKLKRIE